MYTDTGMPSTKAANGHRRVSMTPVASAADLERITQLSSHRPRQIYRRLSVRWLLIQELSLQNSADPAVEDPDLGLW
jgi:hypothetical protein